MSLKSEWNTAVEYGEFIKKARENVEIMKARFNDLMIDEQELEFLRSIENEIHILVIGTDRCNDTAGNLPVLARMESVASNLTLRVLDSDKNARFHENYKVNGKRKTPVVLFLNPEYEEICRWVERPNAAYKLVNEKLYGAVEERKTLLKKIYSDPEIMRQSLSEFMDLLLRTDYVLGRS